MFHFDLMGILYRLPAIFIAFSFHEFAHAYVAYKLGDPTPKNQGRLTLDPFAHIDILGFILLLFMGFGWAKPVRVNPASFKNRRRDDILVSLSGPIMNLALGIIFLCIKYFIPVYNDVFDGIINSIIYINILLAMLNILPFPPLDGYHILKNIFFYRHGGAFWKFERYGFLIMLLLIVTNTLSAIIVPMVNFIIFTTYNILNLF
ncbi:MAG: site-2 protease family protein [Mahellales bacterium]|jgi:Zn-dependent protease